MAVFCIVLLVVTSGCTGDNKSKAGFGNVSIGKPTVVTTVPTSTDTPETMETTEDTEPRVVTPTIDLSCLGTTNCHLYEECLKDCGNANDVQCQALCCNARCYDLPINEDQKRHACAEDCLKKLSAFVDTTKPTPTKTLRPPNIDW
jgi:hypothetical protein